MKKTDKPSYPGLYGLRAISILLVLFFHFDFGFPSVPDSLQWAKPFFDLLHDGQMGVNIFFVISGFLITSLMLQEEAAYGKVSLKDFYLRRTLRIFPAYYFLLLLYAVLQYNGIIHLEPYPWITAITYTKYLNWYYEWYTPHAWSLSMEEQFYLVWPVIFTYAPRFRTITMVVLLFIPPFVKAYDFKQDIELFNILTIFERIDAIAVGCLVALYKDKIIRVLSRDWTLTFWTALIILMMNTFKVTPTTPYLIKVYIVMLGSTFGLVANVAIAAIVLYSVFGPRSLWFRFLNTRPMIYLGLLSYSIYLWQQFFAVNSDYWFTNRPWEFLGILVTALFSYYVVEKPFLKLKARFSHLRIRRQNKLAEMESTGVIE
jgi:peptidoglycan/LPS O-acetylase OafA/YrhL